MLRKILDIFNGLKGPEPQSELVEYKGFTILPEPIPDGGKYRIAAKIEKEVGGELKTHQLIRADTLGGLDEAIEASLAKAKQVIDEQADRLFR
jgi:hypothetical protein